MEKLDHKVSIGKGEKKFESNGSFLLNLLRVVVCDWKLLCKEILQLVLPVMWTHDDQEFHTRECVVKDLVGYGGGGFVSVLCKVYL